MSMHDTSQRGAKAKFILDSFTNCRENWYGCQVLLGLENPLLPNCLVDMMIMFIMRPIVLAIF